MTKLFIVLLVFHCSIHLIGQDTLYFDEHFHEEMPHKTSSVRVFVINEVNTTVEDYHRGKLRLKANISGLTDSKSVHEFVWYIRNHLVEFDHKMYFNDLKATISFFHDNGTTCKTIFTGKDLLYYHVSDSLNQQVLTSGSGKYTYPSTEYENEYAQLIFKDSVLIESFSIRTDKNDTIYNTYDQMAVPPGGIQAFYDGMIKTIRYPVLMQLAGKEAKIYIHFVVDKNGQLTDFEALNPNVTRFDTKTIKKLSKFPPWQPALKNNKPVKTRFRLPVKFELE